MPGYLSGVLRLEIHPTRTVILSFALVILAGTGLLTTSAAATGERFSLALQSERKTHGEFQYMEENLMIG